MKPFLSDVNETARFHAVGSLFAQDEAEEAREILLERLAKEDSMRVKARILDGFAQRNWAVDPAKMSKLPEGLAIDAQGIPRRR